MREHLRRLQTIGTLPTDGPEERLRKTILVTSSAVIFCSATAWGILYALHALWVAAIAAWGYAVFNGLGLFRFSRTADFPTLRVQQLSLLLVAPFLVQASLGGFQGGSAVSIWALLTPLGAVMLGGPVAALPWLAADLVLILASGAADSYLAQIFVPPPPWVVQLFFVLNVAVPSIVAVSLIRYFADERARALEELQAEQQRSDRLLFNMLPPIIADRLKARQDIIADSFDQVTVLFADLVGFTELSRTTPPADMVAMLNQVFTTFDALAEQHGLEKIKTLGDGYHAVAGLPVPRPDHAQAAAEMALDMRAALGALREECGWPLHLRIGIDSGGPVIAGVIGTRKYVYDVWGDTVNAAARMEALGLPDGIHLTESAYRALEGAYVLSERGTMDVKGIGPMRTYLLEQRLALPAEPSIAA